MVKSDDQVNTVTGESLFVNDQFVALGHCTPLCQLEALSWHHHMRALLWLTPAKPGGVPIQLWCRSSTDETFTPPSVRSLPPARGRAQ